VDNLPRLGEAPTVISTLRAQQKLAIAAWQGMKDRHGANQEVGAVRAQLAAHNAIISGSEWRKTKSSFRLISWFKAVWAVK